MGYSIDNASQIQAIMMLSFENYEYGCNNHVVVNWQGVSFNEGSELDSFLQNDVAERLYDIEGQEQFQSHLRGLAVTGMGRQNLERVLNALEDEERSWVAGESLAEAYLIEKQGVMFPWNTERDKRNPKSSLPGADIIGFTERNSRYILVLGEVKTSGEKRYPPQVMSGRSGGLVHQIDNLANNLTTICQLVKWLYYRVRETDYEPMYNDAAINFFNSGNKEVCLFGVLIRDVDPNERDLSGRGEALQQSVSSPTTVDLIAIYLPFEISDLPAKVRVGRAL